MARRQGGELPLREELTIASMDFSHFSKLLQSRDPKLQTVVWILAISAWLPTGVTILESPDMSWARKAAEAGKSLGTIAGGLVLLSIRPEQFENQDASDNLPPN